MAAESLFQFRRLWRKFCHHVVQVGALEANQRQADSLVRRGLLRDRSLDNQERPIFERWYRRASVGSRLLYWKNELAMKKRQ